MGHRSSCLPIIVLLFCLVIQALGDESAHENVGREGKKAAVDVGPEPRGYKVASRGATITTTMDSSKRKGKGGTAAHIQDKTTAVKDIGDVPLDEKDAVIDDDRGNSGAAGGASPHPPPQDVADNTIAAAAATTPTNETGPTGDGATTTPPVIHVTQKVEPPVFDPTDTIHAVSVTITISCPTEGVIIYYTTDGSLPGPKSLSVQSGGRIVWETLGETTFQALATKAGWENSEITSQTYQVFPRVIRPNFGGVEDEATYTGSINVTIATPTEGSFICYTLDEKILPNPAACPLTIPNGGMLSLDTPGLTVIRAIGLKDGWAPSPMAEVSFYLMGQVAAPYFEPSTHIFITSATLVVKCKTEGAHIYYTTDGTDPSPSNGNLALPDDTIYWGKKGEITIQAIAQKDGMADSAMTVVVIKVLERTQPPKLELLGTYYSSEGPTEYTFIRQVNFTWTSKTPNATILYHQGPGIPRPSDPLAQTLVPGEIIAWSELGHTTFHAIATKSGMANSEVVELSLTLIRELYVEYPMHHLDYEFYLDPVEAADPSPEVTAINSNSSKEGTTGSNTTFSRGNNTTSSADINSTVADMGKHKNHKHSAGEGPTRVNGTLPEIDHTHRPSSNDSQVGEDEEEVEDDYYDDYTDISNGTSSPYWNPNNVTNSSLVPMPHNRYRRPLSVKGYEGVQPVVSIHVVEAMFKECAFCSARRVRGRFVTLDNPSKHFSFLQQFGGCGHPAVLPSTSGRAYKLPPRPVEYVPAGFNETILEELNRLTTQQYDDVKDLGCQVVTNGGFFNTTNFDCLGNLVSNGEVIRLSDTHNTNFGMRNGSFVIGYLTKEDISDPNNPFQELISGLLWLVRDGENFVEASLEEEYMGFQETGSQFATVKSARTALGHDRAGRLIILQMQGETWAEGVDLYEFADLLVELGVVNAINLDGGGSATMTQNHSLVNDPTWLCDSENPKSLFRCEKPVATITCIHASAPPIFVPVETTWANWTNITLAANALAERQAHEAHLLERRRVCAGFCPDWNVSMNATDYGWFRTAEARYKMTTWVFGVFLLLSLLINATHPCVRQSTGSLLGSCGRKPSHDQWGASARDNETGPGSSANQSKGRRWSSGRRKGNFQPVRNYDDEEDDEEVEVDLPLSSEHEGVMNSSSGSTSTGRGRANSNYSRLRSVFNLGSRRGRSGEDNVREVELEINPFLSSLR